MNIEDLKCCGNCKHSENWKECVLEGDWSSYNYCDGWQFDNRSQEEREPDLHEEDIKRLRKKARDEARI